MKRLRIVVVGTLAGDPYAGMAWMHMQIVLGLCRLGHDAYYFETTSTWPYDPVRGMRVADSVYAVPYLNDVASRFGLDGRWAYRRSYSDKAWLGMSAARAEEILASADLVLNVAGSTRLREEGLRVGPLVYFGTDPVYHEASYDNGDAESISIVEEHDAVVTYGENIGTEHSPVPALPKLCAHTRQPVIMDMWAASGAARNTYTTVGNWKQAGRDVMLRGEQYRWSKHFEFMKFIDLPQRVSASIELAMNLTVSDTAEHGDGTAVPAYGLSSAERAMLLETGWQLTESSEFTLDPWRYREYILGSRAEFTVARDLNVRLKSGWFSERSACYLAAGRPVVTQDTGFGTVLPTGSGLFAFNTLDEAVEAIESIESDYERHSRAARDIAAEYFSSERVLPKLLDDIGSLSPRQASAVSVDVDVDG
ncbi:MAG: hypothetical protein H7X80_03510 [bacterium]|nr:hypothetical protein [Candidatus Kapabacteria bacterium]